MSATLTRTYEFVDNRHTQDPEQLLNDFADTISRTGSLIFRGQSKGDVKEWFIEHVGRTEADLRRAGKDGISASGPGARSASADERAPADTFTPYFTAPKDIPIIVAGARNAAISMVFRVFGEWSNTSVAIETAPLAAVKGG